MYISCYDICIGMVLSPWTKEKWLDLAHHQIDTKTKAV